MEYEIDIDLGDLGDGVVMVQALVDCNDGVTLTHVMLLIGSRKINVVSLLTVNAMEYIENQYFDFYVSETKSIEGKHLYDEHDYS